MLQAGLTAFVVASDSAVVPASVVSAGTVVSPAAMELEIVTCSVWRVLSAAVVAASVVSGPDVVSTAAVVVTAVVSPVVVSAPVVLFRVVSAGVVVSSVVTLENNDTKVASCA